MVERMVLSTNFVCSAWENLKTESSAASHVREKMLACLHPWPPIPTCKGDGQAVVFAPPWPTCGAPTLPIEPTRVHALKEASVAARHFAA